MISNVIYTPTDLIATSSFHTRGVIINDEDLNFHPDYASTLRDLPVDTLLALIGQELRKLHFRVTRSDMMGYMIVRKSVKHIWRETCSISHL